MPDAPVLLVAAHGTRSAAGSATTASLIHAVAHARPHLDVRLCFLDVVGPSLTEALDALGDQPCVVVPLLLSAGYHVRTDIPAVVAGRPSVRVARHLGCDPLLVDALVDRLAAARAGVPVSTALVSVGSSRPDARADLDATAALLGERLSRQVTVLTLAGDIRASLVALPAPVEVATYLLAEGDFVEALRAAASGVATVSDPIGVHPALVSLVLARYDEMVADRVR